VVVIRTELRKTGEGEGETWANLGDILDWLDTVRAHTPSPVAGDVALAIKRRLLDAVGNAEVVQKGE
jgi:hypothetical protein